MIRRLTVGLLALAASGLAAAGAAGAEPFRIAAAGAATTPCAAPGGSLAPGERAYYDHLAKRLGRSVQRCVFASEAEAAAALAAGGVDLARLSPAGYAPVAAKVRATLTVRRKSEANRIPVMIVVRSADPARDVAALKGRTISFGGTSPAGLATPRAVLADRGLAESAYTSEIARDGDAAMADLIHGKVDAAAVNGAAWQRVCLIVSPKAPPPCGELRQLAHARPRAAQALAVRRDMPADQRYRLIGVFLAMHLENPAAFAFAAGVPDGAEFQPAEAEALAVADLK